MHVLPGYCSTTLLFGWCFECTTRCCLCHNVFLITIPEVRCQQAASNPICITCFPSSLLNSWEGCGHQSLLTSHAVKHFLHQLLGPHSLCATGPSGTLHFQDMIHVLYTNHCYSSNYQGRPHNGHLLTMWFLYICQDLHSTSFCFEILNKYTDMPKTWSLLGQFPTLR